MFVLAKSKQSISSVKLSPVALTHHLYEAKGNLTAEKPTLPGTPPPWDLGTRGEGVLRASGVPTSAPAPGPVGPRPPCTVGSRECWGVGAGPQPRVWLISLGGPGIQHLFTYLFKHVLIDLREEREKHRLATSCPHPDWGLCPEPGMCPDWRSNPHPLRCRGRHPAY